MIHFDKRQAGRAAVVVALALVAATSLAAPEGEQVLSALWRLEKCASDPLDSNPPEETTNADPDARRHLAIARSILTVEAQIDSARAVLEHRVLPLLSLARNNVHLGLRRRALDWYEKASLADNRGEFSDTILEESIACAIALNDSTLLVGHADSILDRDDAREWGQTLADILGALEDRELGSLGVQLVDRISALGPKVGAPCRLELARYHQRQNQDLRAAQLYDELLGRQSELDDRQLALVLVGLADSRLASGNEDGARSLYTAYREHDAGRLSAWSSYQLGGLEATAGNFDQAIALFRSLCEREGSTPWKDSACDRLAQMRQLAEIEGELAPFGRSLSTRRGTR